MNIKILGGGCPNCERLENNVKEALKLLSKEAVIEKVKDYNDILSYGVMSTPALVVDGKVVVSGKVPNVKKLQKMLDI
jgi:small redox-active disulfide protein 2